MKTTAFVCACALLLAGEVAHAQQVIRGRAISADAQTPVAGAVVTHPATGVQAITAADGTFQLTVNESGAANLTVEHIGYITLHRAVHGSDVVLRLERKVTELDALVITASRRLQKLVDTPVTTELITRREIEETGGSDVAAVLLERTGIALEGGHPNGTGAMLQGFDAQRVLILLDGQPLTGRMSGSFDVSRIPAAMLERIEVVKGPQSTLFGSDALGGVVNLITRNVGNSTAVSAEATSGTQGRIDFSGRVQGSLGTLQLLADGGRRQIGLTPGISRDAGARSEQWDVMLKARLPISDAMAVEASGLLVDESQRWQTGQLYNFADNLQLSGRLGAEVTLGAHRFAPTLFTSEFRHTPARSSTTDITTPGITETQRLRELEITHSYQNGRIAFDNGVEARAELLRSPNIQGEERSLDGVDAYSQLTWSLGRIDLVPGVRVSSSEAWGTHWTPRMALRLRATDALTLRLSAGNAYRAPAFKELFMSFLNAGASTQYMVRGNADLRPESSTNYSVGLEVTQPRYYIRGQLFHNNFDDFIETQLVGDSAGFALYTYGNIANGVTRGGEVEVNTTWRGARLEAGYSYLDAYDSNTDEELLGRPRHSGRLYGGYTFSFGTRVGVTGVFTGRTPIQRTETETLMRSAFTRLDARISHEVLNGVELSVGANNVFDARPAGWPGYTGRHMYIGAAWRPSSLEGNNP